MAEDFTFATHTQPVSSSTDMAVAMPPLTSTCRIPSDGVVVAPSIEAESASMPVSDATVEALSSQSQNAEQTAPSAGLQEPGAGRPPLFRLKRMAETMPYLPALYKRVKPGSVEASEIGAVNVAAWSDIKKAKLEGNKKHFSSADGTKTEGLRQAVQKVTKVSRTKGNISGRTYTSKYRGVHQTFPTRRWEAQFRRNGKPTSLGCFDYEEEAARAYDKMMIWCELHQSASVKGGITNFDIADYEEDVELLQQLEQDQLVAMLRRDGRTQAAQGSLGIKSANLRTPGSRRNSESGTQSDGEGRSDHGADSGLS